MHNDIAVVGGGPGGLFFATLIARQDPSARVVVYERNRRTDVFGFGVVFSDATLKAIDAADPVLRDALRDHGVHWDRIDVVSAGERHSFGGNGMAAIHRRTLLSLLQDNAEAAGVEVRYGTEAPSLRELRASHRLVVGADGTGSGTRRQLEEDQDLGHSVDVASAKFIWFATEHLFDGLTFLHRASEHGNFAVHGYPISDRLSTFIVETDPETWRRAGLDRFDATQPPGPSDEASEAYVRELFADDIGGAPLVANNSRWASFRTRRTQRWAADGVALLGDAVHTAHFSVGSGTKMAMEDAIALAREVTGAQDLDAALEAYQESRKPAVARIQDAAVPSLAWWEHFGQYQRELDPLTFAFHFFSRSIAVDKMASRDPGLVEAARSAWATDHGRDALHTPLDLLGATSRGRSLQLEQRPDGFWLEEAGSQLLPVTSGDDGGAGPADLDGAPVALLVRAPGSQDELPDAIGRLPHRGVAVVAGGTALTRTLLCEEARLRRGLVAVLVDDLSEAAVETALLSHRADAVASPQGGVL